MGKRCGEDADEECGIEHINPQKKFLSYSGHLRKVD
jgi:hypothetical protein